MNFTTETHYHNSLGIRPLKCQMWGAKVNFKSVHFQSLNQSVVISLVADYCENRAPLIAQTTYKGVYEYTYHV